MISQCLPAEGGQFIADLVRRNLGGGRRRFDIGTVFVTGNVSLPEDAQTSIRLFALPVKQFSPTDTDSRRMFINSLTADDP